MTNPYVKSYTTRLIWPTKGRSQFDIEDARSRARSLQLRLQEMIMFRDASPSDIRRLAIHCRGLALAGDDPVTADNARQIVNRFAPRKVYSAAQRAAIRDKAIAVLVRLTPPESNNQSHHHKSNQHKTPWMSAAEQRRVQAWLARERKQKR